MWAEPETIFARVDEAMHHVRIVPRGVQVVEPRRESARVRRSSQETEVELIHIFRIVFFNRTGI
jgi:hypothetical protein